MDWSISDVMDTPGRVVNFEVAETSPLPPGGAHTNHETVLGSVVASISMCAASRSAQQNGSSPRSPSRRISLYKYCGNDAVFGSLNRSGFEKSVSASTSGVNSCVVL